VTRSKHIVSRHSQRIRRLAQGGLVLLCALVAVAMYELGLRQAGFSRIGAIAESAQLEADKHALTKENKALSERVAVLETAAKIDREAYGKVESELSELQNRIQAQQEDIEFYKGIVNENDGTGLRIQDFSVSHGLGEREFDLRLVLAQAFRTTRLVSGQVELVLEGMQSGAPTRLGLDVLRPEAGGGTRMAYSFRYFQDLKAEVVIPADFVPERVHVIVRTKGKKPKTVEEFFIWNVKPG
jgi:hypothetical protein